MNSDEIDYYCMLTLMQDRAALGVKAYTYVRDAVAMYRHMTYEDIREFFHDKTK